MWIVTSSLFVTFFVTTFFKGFSLITTNEKGSEKCDDIITHPKPSVCYSFSVYTAISFFTSASVISESFSSIALCASNSLLSRTWWIFFPTGHFWLGFSWKWNNSSSGAHSTALYTSRNVICSNGLVIVTPPVPLATSIRPAAFNCYKILRTITGLVPMLAAIKSLVIFWSENVSIQANIWIAIVNLLEICIINTSLRQ